MHLLKVFDCKHCKKHFAVVKARNTFIPVECEKDAVYPSNTEYSRFTMVTHLKNCEGRKNDWQELVKRFKAFPESRFAEIPDNLPPTALTGEPGEAQSTKGYNPVIKNIEAYNASKQEFQKQLEKERQ